MKFKAIRNIKKGEVAPQLKGIEYFDLYFGKECIGYLIPKQKISARRIKLNLPVLSENQFNRLTFFLSTLKAFAV